MPSPEVSHGLDMSVMKVVFLLQFAIKTKLFESMVIIQATNSDFTSPVQMKLTEIIQFYGQQRVSSDMIATNVFFKLLCWEGICAL